MGVHWPDKVCSAKFSVLVFKVSLLWYWGGRSNGQSRVICQVLCSGIQVISPLVLGGPLTKAGSSAKFGVLVFNSPLLWHWGVPLALVGASAKFYVVVCKSSLLWNLGGPLVKVGLSATFGVLVFKASLLWYWGGGHWLK